MRIVITGKVDGKCEGTVFTYRHPERSPRSFSLVVRRRVFEKEKRETPYRGRAVLSVKGFAQEEGKGLSLLEMRGDIP